MSGRGWGTTDSGSAACAAPMARSWLGANAPVPGCVRVRCARGVTTVPGRRATLSLYSTSLATYDRDGDTFDHSAARGFIELFGLPLRNQARAQGALEDLAPLSLPRQVRRAH